MKKILLTAACLMAGFTATFAQEEGEETIGTFQFVTADRTIVPNGSTIYAKKYTEGTFGGKSFIPSGLYVMNTSEDPACISIKINVEELSNGSIQLCYPSTCANYTLGIKETTYGTKDGGEVSDLQTEWMPDGTGQAKVTYTIMNYEYLGLDDQPIPQPVYQFEGEGSSVTVIYQYDPASINNVESSENAVAIYFDMTGRQVANPAKGLYVKKTVNANGNVKSQKVIIK